MPTTTRGRIAALLTTIAAIAAAIALALQPAATPPPDPVPTSSTPAPTSPVAKVDADADGKRDEVIRLTDAEALQYAAIATNPKSELSEPLRGPDDNVGVGEITGPLAADSIDGCRTRFTGNFSQRVYGPNPGVVGMHQTVTFDRPGDDQAPLIAQGSRRSSGTSWHFLIGGIDGLCTYMVPMKYSAWTQASANSVAIGIEIQAYGTEKQYLTPTAQRKVVRVLLQIHDRYGIPMRRGRVEWTGRCRPIVVKRGIVEHSELGPCGGGHADVTPWSTDPLIAAAAKALRDRARACTTLRQNRRQLAALPPQGKRTTAQARAAAAHVKRIQAIKRRAGSLALNTARCR